MTTVDQVAPLDSAATAPVPVASRLIGAIAVGVALLSATATFLVLSGLTPIAPVHEVVVKLLLGNAVTGLLLLAIIGREVWVVVQARRRGRAGSRLHVQIVSLFAVIAAVPTILVAVVASTTLDRGRRLCQRARPGNPRRSFSHGLRCRAGQTAVRSGSRSIREIPYRAGYS